jgi:hypothetical protein
VELAQVLHADGGFAEEHKKAISRKF